MSTSVIIGLALLAIVLAIILWFIVTYNGFVRLRNLVQESWRQIDVELNRRYYLIPNLVETVRGYTQHEQSTLQAVIQARNIATQPATTLAQRSANEGALTDAISRLFALAENYPTLRADTSFLNLQQELTNTEDRIAAGRRFYNANVRDLNTKRESFPSNIVANMFHFGQAEYFQVDQAQVSATPQINFGGIGGVGQQMAHGQAANGWGANEQGSGSQPGNGQPGVQWQAQPVQPEYGSPGAEGYRVPPSHPGGYDQQTPGHYGQPASGQYNPNQYGQPGSYGEQPNPGQYGVDR